MGPVTKESDELSTLAEMMALSNCYGERTDKGRARKRSDPIADLRREKIKETLNKFFDALLIVG